ncbi:MAG: TatD family hydrolase [Chromatiales bacterium]|jgi:TatD DNase family protein|nr:TatD family hydrolase [Chromatiales bacterium]MDX9765981.1 TatD family hydrolase [Ectothiorhodospiraceae bacterium]
MRLIDSHCHFDDDAFLPDRAAAWRRAQDAGVVAQVLPALAHATWPRLKRVAETFPGLYPAYGLHPMYLDEHRVEHLAELRRWIEDEQPLAIGECGLDYFVESLDRVRQMELFVAQVDIALLYDLPLIIHARRAVDDVLMVLRRRPGARGVIHSFAGSEQQARAFIGLGFSLGFGGPVTYARANRLRGLVRELPLESILIETDAPDQPGSLHRGERNEPAFLPEILHEIAALRGEDAGHVAEITSRNACRLFGIAP